MNVEYFTLSAHRISASFEAVFRVAKERDLDFGILSHHSVGVQEQAKITALLERKEVRTAAVSVGVGPIRGKGFMFSPKIPYVSEEGIIVNVKHCEELGIPEHLQTSNTPSHFEDAGGLHATLLSFLEAVVPYGELYSYPYEGDSKDAYTPWHSRLVHGVLKYIKGAFNRVTYEIQKKYEDKT